MNSIQTLADLIAPMLADSDDNNCSVNIVDGTIYLSFWNEHGDIGDVSLPADILAASPEVIIKAYNPS